VAFPFYARVADKRPGWLELDQVSDGNLPTGSSRSRFAGLFADILRRRNAPDKVGTLPVMRHSPGDRRPVIHQLRRK
jgi:hypothetical protein